jgi:hypothetical protein
LILRRESLDPGLIGGEGILLDGVFLFPNFGGNEFDGIFCESEWDISLF